MKLFSYLLAIIALSASAHIAQGQSLQEIYELALNNDAQLKAYRAQFKADQEQAIIARSALLPRVSASYDYSETETTTIANSLVGLDESGGGVIREIESFSDTTAKGYVVSLNQALFDLPAWFSFQSTRALSDRAEATFAAQQQDLIVRVAQAYFGVLRAEDNLAASQAQERALARQLEQTQQRFEVGLIALTDVHEAQAVFDLARVARLTDENNLAVALEGLSVLTNVDHDRLSTLSETFPITPPEPADRAAWVDFALANNLELKAARLAEDAAANGEMRSEMGTVGVQQDGLATARPEQHEFAPEGPDPLDLRLLEVAAPGHREPAIGNRKREMSLRRGHRRPSWSEWPRD